MVRPPSYFKSREGEPYASTTAVERDLSSFEPAVKTVALHDGTGTQPEGLYWFDEPNNQWVKVSSNDTGSSVTIGL